MPDRSPIVRRAIRAETTATEALLLAERMRAIGAWSAYSAMAEIVGAQRERAARARKRMTGDWVEA